MTVAQAIASSPPAASAFPADLDLTLVSRRPARLKEPTASLLESAAVPVAAAPQAGRARVSVVIVTHNQLPFTKLCLGSLLANTATPDPAYEVIVVDNASSDATADYLRVVAAANPHVHAVSNATNRGFAAANNQGIALARGDVLVLLNNDTVVPRGWLAGLVRHVEDSAAGAVGPVTNRIGNEAEVETPYRTYGEFEEFARRHAFDHAGAAFDIPTPCMFCLALRREVFEKVGPLDERFEVGLLEDDDYALRVRAAGYRTLCAEDVFVHHFGQASFGELVPTGEYARLLEANKLRFEQKWGRPWVPYGRRPGRVYLRTLDRVGEVARRVLPPGAKVAVVSRGDDELLARVGGRALHFPQTSDGTYAGCYPADGAAAVEELEAVRARGVEFLLLPGPSLWWLEHYTELKLHLERRYRRLTVADRHVDEVGCVIFDLRVDISAPRSAAPVRPGDLYLDLMKRCLTNWIYADTEPQPFDPAKREDGRDWPPTAHTMVGLKRLDNLQACVEDVLARHVPGDLIETGVWRGGASILMRAVLKAHGVTDRRVWLADSFEGLPPPDVEKYPQDAGDHLHTMKELAVSLEEVRANFTRYGLLDDLVCFLRGWFRDTLPAAPVERLAVMRLDGDMYESTMDGLVHLYPKLSVGGYVIVDDYGYYRSCRQAVHDYRDAHGIDDEIRGVDWTGVYWRKSR